MHNRYLQRSLDKHAYFYNDMYTNKKLFKEKKCKVFILGQCMLKPRTAKTFLEYGDQVFYPFIESKLRNVSRVDVVFDQYLPDSLKEAARQKRGKGVRRRVSGEI